MGLLTDAKHHLADVVAPTLRPTIRGEFQVGLTGMRTQRGPVYVSALELRVVEAGRKDVIVHRFGEKAVWPGHVLTLDEVSTMQWLPPDIPGFLREAKPEPALFQARVVGAMTNQAEIEMRLVSPTDHDQAIHSFGSMVVWVGRAVTLHGLEVTLQLLSEEERK